MLLTPFYFITSREEKSILYGSPAERERREGRRQNKQTHPGSTHPIPTLSRPNACGSGAGGRGAEKIHKKTKKA